jgi:glucose-6-phosphate isomerase
VIKNNIKSKYLNKSFSNKLSKKYEKIFSEINNNVKNPRETLNILDGKFSFNFKIQDLKRFNKFKSIALIGMGGSILGAEAIYNFLEKKIKKKIYFFNDLNENKITNFKKKNKLSKVLFIIISKSGTTIETLSNVFLLKIIKKNSKNIILISEKKIIYYLIYQNNLI